MKKLSIAVALLLFLIYFNQVHGQPPYGTLERPILMKIDTTIIMQNNWISVIISMKTGEISTFYYLTSTGARNLLTDTAFITIRDKRDTVEYRQSAGKVAKIDTISYLPDSVQAVFDINFGLPPPAEYPYSIRIKYTLSIQAFHWNAELKTGLRPDREANIDFSFPVIANMDYAFWAKDGTPFKLPMTRTVTYRGRPVVLPALIQYNDTNDIGLSFVSPFEIRKPGLRWEMQDSSFIVSNYYLRLSTVHPCIAGLYIVPHEGDWRPGLAWLYNKYPSYFNPVSESVIKGEGWFGLIDETTGPDYFEYLREYGVKWVEFYSHNPFFGVYAPPDKDSWIIIYEENDTMSYDNWLNDVGIDDWRHTSYDSNQAKIDSLRNHDIQTYNYFQSFESWIQYADRSFFGQYAQGADLEPLSAWRQCYLMNPDPDEEWGKHIVRQIDSLLIKYPNINGILYDRDDYCDYDYNPLHNDDGVTMIGSDTAYMLGFAQEKINYHILKAVHEHDSGTADKGVWTNQPTSVEVCKDMDGIMSEDIVQAPYQQYLGISRPMILLPKDTTLQQTEEKLKTALSTGHFPSIAWYRADSECINIDKKYQPLFALYKGKKWILYPHALQLPEGIKGNIFQTPDSDYLVPMIEPERYSSKVYPEPETTHDIFRYDRWVKVNVPDSLELEYCYLLSGDYQGINQDTIYKDSGLEIRVPVHRVSSLIQLSKEPKYEITRISSPVLTRGDSGKFEIKVHNISSETEISYDILLFTTFVKDSFVFSLPPERCTIIGISFEIDTYYPLGEDTMKAIERVRDSTVVFTSWVVDFLQFEIPDTLLFIHHLAGESIPIILANNTSDTLNVTVSGKFDEGGGQIEFIGQPFTIYPLEAKELKAFIISDEELGKVSFQAETEGHDNIEAVRRIERIMSLNHQDNLFQDDFSSGTMDSWEIIYDTWDARDSIAKNTGDSSHLALAEASSPDWDDYKFQVNTMLKGSVEPQVDWLRSLIYFRVQDTSNYYCFGFSGWSAADELNLFKREGNKWTQLATYPLYPYKIKKDVWYNLRIEVEASSVPVNENNIRCFIDGKQIINVFDTDTLLTSGGVGIGVLYESMRNCYDDVVVRRIQR
jgi:hypothetical protein